MRELRIESVRPEWFHTKNYVVLDFEVDTSHGDYGHPVHPKNGIILACWKRAGDTEVTRAWADEYGLGMLLKTIEDADLLVAHNAKYELGWLVRCGLDLTNVLVFDTKLGEYVLMGNLAAGDELNAPRSTSLDDCCIRRGWPVKDPVVDVLIGHGVNPARIPRPWLEQRCVQDVVSTERLYHDQLSRLEDSGRLGVLLTRCLLTPLLAEAELEGMHLDEDRVEKAHAEYSAKYDELSVKMERATNGINWKSAKQIAEFLYNPPKPTPKFDSENRQLWAVPNRNGRLVEVSGDTPEYEKLVAAFRKRMEKVADDPAVVNKLVDEGIVRVWTSPGLGFSELKKPGGEPKRTRGGQPLTDQHSINALVPETPEQKDWVALRKELGKTSAALTKALQFFHGVVKEYNGKFHAVINQTTTATHRTSSTGIPLSFECFGGETKSAQFQNLFNAFKPLFRASSPDRRICEVDGSQLEFRVAAQVSGDEQMIADILDPTFDAHITSAAAMNELDYSTLLAKYKSGDAAAAKLRKKSKPYTFGPLYGKSRGNKEELRWISEFRKRYAGFYQWSEKNVHTVLADRILVLPWGMRYYWPKAQLSSTGYINCTTAVYNYPIQGFATAEIIPVALTAFRLRVRAAIAAGRVGENDIVLINTVHDSLLCDVADSAVEVWKELAEKAFTLDVYEYLRNVYHYEFDRVPLGVGLNIGTHWADEANHEEEWNVFPNGRRVQIK